MGEWGWEDIGGVYEIKENDTTVGRVYERRTAIEAAKELNEKHAPSVTGVYRFRKWLKENRR